MTFFRTSASACPAADTLVRSTVRQGRKIVGVLRTFHLFVSL